MRVPAGRISGRNPFIASFNIAVALASCGACAEQTSSKGYHSKEKNLKVFVRLRLFRKKRKRFSQVFSVNSFASSRKGVMVAKLGPPKRNVESSGRNAFIHCA